MRNETLSEKNYVQSNAPNDFPAKRLTWAGYLVGILPALFLLLDAAMKLIKPAPVVEATLELGYPESSIFGIGAVLLISTILYSIPRTTVLGAILLTGYLGGAAATHVRVGGGLFPILFPVIIGALLWGGLYVRDERIRTLISLRRQIPELALRECPVKLLLLLFFEQFPFAFDAPAVTAQTAVCAHDAVARRN